MTEDDDVVAGRPGGGRPGVDPVDAIIETKRGFGADGAAGGEAEMADEDVGARLRHRHRILTGEHIGRGEHVHGGGSGDQLDLQSVAHAGLLEIGAEDAVDQPDGREVLDAGKAQSLQLAEEFVGDQERVGAVDAGEDRGVADHREHLVRHFDDDVVGVAISHQPGQRAAAGHTVAPGIVDHDQVDAAGLFGLGAEAGAGAAADDGAAGGDLAVQVAQDVLAGKSGHVGKPQEERSSGKFVASAAAKAGSLM